MLSTGVGGIICAAHRGADGVLHGHSYEVTAWWTFGGDATDRQAQLNAALDTFDHTELLHELSLAEHLAEAILNELGATEVEVRRPLERLYARAVRV